MRKRKWKMSIEMMRKMNEEGVEDVKGDDDDDGEIEVEDVDRDDEYEEDDEFVNKEDEDVEEEDGNGMKEKEEEDRGRKEYESEDNEEMKGGIETSPDCDEWIESRDRRIPWKPEEDWRGGKEGECRCRGDVGMKGEKGVSEKDAISYEDEFEVDTTTDHMRSRCISPVDDESIPDRVNLIDLLYNEGCISFRHKQRIEEQPTKQLQNIEMFQLIKNGSIKTLKLANDYFIRTGQRNVFEMVNKKYHIGG